MNRTTRRTLCGPLGAATIALTAAGLALVPGTAQAAENVHSSYTVFCEPDEQADDSSTDPAGVSFDGEHNGLTASPEQHWITSRSQAVTGHDFCDGDASFSDLLTVGVGSSGLQAGDLVPVTVTVTLDGAVEESWNDSDPAEWGTDTSFAAAASIRSLDGCTDDGEVQECDTPLSFQGDHRHELDAGGPFGSDPDGYVEARAHRSWDATTNAVVGTDPDTDEPLHFSDGEWVNESRPGDDPTRVCEAWPCPYVGDEMHADPVAPVVFSGPANLVVGYRYAIEGSLDWQASRYGNPTVLTSATVDEFSFTLTPAAGFEGVDLGYASEGGAPADTVAPGLEGLEDVSVPAGPGGTAVVDWSVTATDDVDPAPVVTCDPPSGSTFAFGQTTVTCTATDASGNTSSDTFVVTVTAAQGDVMDRLRDAIEAANVGPVVRTVLLILHRTADAQLDAGRTRAGCGLLQAMEAGVRASGRSIPAADAATLRGLIAEARATYGC